ncbi:MAG TPA: GGDEF domain-containing protein [Candidatus Binatia bacterium]|nr:GGDEF domain-containing protein [Candidatus Binatia bacterium]
MRVRDKVIPGTGAVVAARPVAKAAKVSAAAPVTGAAEAARAEPVDEARFLGLTETELSPSVRAALQTLLDEVARLREELNRTRKRIAHLERLADEDAMLPIANRRAFVRELTRLISYSERYGSPGSVLYFDLNGMKIINDRFGHAAGDAVLQHFATLLVNNVRDSDVVGRLGGDEFGVILAQADRPQAEEKAEQLLGVIKGTPMDWEGNEITLSCAVGIHQFSGEQTADDALSEADASMYREKKKHYDGKPPRGG